MQDHSTQSEPSNAASSSQEKTRDDLLVELIAELSAIREELENITLACRRIDGGVRGEG